MQGRLSLLKEVKSPFRHQTGYRNLPIQWLLKVTERELMEKMEKMAWKVLGVRARRMTTNGLKKHNIISHLFFTYTTHKNFKSRQYAGFSTYEPNLMVELP